MTPEQILMKRANRLKWYNANKEHVKNYIKNRYNTDYGFWKKKPPIMNGKNTEFHMKTLKRKREDQNLKIPHHLLVHQIMKKFLK